MATNIYSSTPQVILEGIRDESGRVVLPEPEAQPQHLPLFYTFAEKGDPEDVKVVVGSSLANTFGTKMLDPLSEYATHATPFIQGLNEAGNLMMIKRLKPQGAATAFIRFSLGVTKVELMDYPRDNSGKVIMVNGELPEKQPTGKEGYALRWYVNENLVDVKEVIANSKSAKYVDRYSQLLAAYGGEEALKVYAESLNFGDGLVYGRDLPGIGEAATALGTGIRAPEDEHVYPIIDLEVSHFGDYGNNLGVRLYCPTKHKNSVVKPDESFFNATAYRPYMIEFIQRKNRRSSSRVVSNLYGESGTSFVLRPSAVNPLQGNEDMYLESRVLDFYRNLDTTGGRVATYGPFNKIKVYQENLTHILETLYKAEKAADEEAAEKANDLRNSGADVDASIFLAGGYYGPRLLSELEGIDNQEKLDAELKWQLDIFGAKSVDALAYRSFYMIGMSDEGKELAPGVDHWAVGGDDGLMTNAEYNRLVSDELLGFDDAGNKMHDLARYPFSVFYDTGFPMEVKEDIVTLIRRRKDVSIALATHSVSENVSNLDSFPGVEELSPSVEAARLRQLVSWARLFPESEVYNTGACRANIILQCGTIIGNAWKGKVPMTYELMMKRAAFMGANNGKMRPGLGYDQDGIKQLRYVKEVNNPFVPFTAREVNWTHGATWAQFYDRNTMFFPAVRTIYKDETSVLLSDINMLIATDLEKVCFRTWRRLVGNSKLTNEQFRALSDQYILEDTEGRYDGRVVIKPYTYYTKGDETRGYSWHCEIHMYANNMKTVGVMTVVTHRMEDLEG